MIKLFTSITVMSGTKIDSSGEALFLRSRKQILNNTEEVNFNPDMILTKILIKSSNNINQK